MIGIDANVLVALAIEEHPMHAAAIETLEREVASDEQFAHSTAIASEFLHVVTDPRRVDPVQDMAAAVTWLRAWNLEIRPSWLVSTAPVVELWLEWMEKFRLGRKRITDTQYAALLHYHGVTRLITNNEKDFRVFWVFELVPL
jgi:predicted nucleic acid-binding protein